MPQIKVSLAGVVLGEFDEEKLTLSEAFAIKAASGLALKPFFEGMNDMDPLSLQTLVWFLRFKKGDSVPLPEVDFVLADLAMENVEPADPPPEPAATEAISAGSETTPSGS